MPEVPPLLSARRTVRIYTGAPVPSDLLRTVLEAAVCAPSAHNAQPSRFVVIESRAAKRRLAERMAERWRSDMEQLGTPEAAIKVELRFSLKRFGDAPGLILAGYSMEDMDVYPDPVQRAAEEAMAVQSAAAAVQNLLLAAAANGLGACWCCAPLFCPDLVRGTLGLADDFSPQALVTLGFPAHTPPVPPRKPLDALVTFL